MFSFENPKFLKTLDKLEQRLIEKLSTALRERRPALLSEATQGLQAACRTNPDLANPLMYAARTMALFQGNEEVRAFFHLKALSAAQTSLIHGPQTAFKEKVGAFILNLLPETTALLGGPCAARFAREVALHCPLAQNEARKDAVTLWKETTNALTDIPRLAAEIQAAFEKAQDSVPTAFQAAIEQTAKNNRWKLVGYNVLAFRIPHRLSPKGPLILHPRPPFPVEGTPKAR